MALSKAQLRQRSKAGKANVARHGLEHMRRIGRLGGRPTWQEELRKARLGPWAA